MKILITGINGQVGHALMRHLKEHELFGLTRQDCDLMNHNQIIQVIDQNQPDIIINSAAYTKVNQAEDEPELAFKINRDAPKVMAEKSREYEIPFIHFSTDYVFDGIDKHPYTEDDRPNPLGVYGESKLAGEESILAVGGRVYVFRTCWIYSNIGDNFYLNIKRKIQENEKLSVVKDQIGTPTSNLFIAKQIKKIITNLSMSCPGIYNLVPSGSCSWFDFAMCILKMGNYREYKNRIVPISSNEFPAQAKRPLNSCLLNEKIQNTFMIELEDWRSVFKNFLNQTNE